MNLHHLIGQMITFIHITTKSTKTISPIWALEQKIVTVCVTILAIINQSIYLIKYSNSNAIIMV